MSRTNADLLVSQVADIAECHPNTVRSAEKKGLISSRRDINNYRRFTVNEALKLKKALAWRSSEAPQPVQDRHE